MFESTPVSFYDLKFPELTVLDLIEKLCLKPSEYRRLYSEHDAGDEDVRARPHILFVCGWRDESGRWCRRDPHHWGKHDWEPRPLRSPARILRHLKDVEDLCRDAIESRAAPEQVTDCLRQANDVRDTLELDVTEESHWPACMPDSESIFDQSLSARTTDAQGVSWRWDPIDTWQSLRALLRQLRERYSNVKIVRSTSVHP